jgi:enolase-phosphatase E1
MRFLAVDWVLLDIEGTTSNLAFVHEVLFPYARARLLEFLVMNQAQPVVTEALEQVARDAGAGSFREWCPAGATNREALEWVVSHLHGLMDRDSKTTGLKRLQGLIWEGGYRDGTLRSHVFDEVPTVLERWSQAGIGLAIYSSGSIAAQKLYFAHTIAGNLGGFFAHHFDTTVGGKREAASYRRISGELGGNPGRILFVSDVAEELDAAAAAGFHTALAERPGNRPVPECRHPRVRVLTDLELERA